MHEVQIKELDNGDQYIVIPDELVNDVGWEIGDEIQWIDNKDGSWTMKKVEEEITKTEFVLVESIHTFRMRHIIEVPKGNQAWAEAMVDMNEPKEFSQEFIGNTIVSSRVIPKEDIIPLCDKDNDYCRMWNDEHKMNTFVTFLKDNPDV